MTPAFLQTNVISVEVIHLTSHSTAMRLGHDRPRFTELLTLRGHTAALNCLRFSHNGLYLLSAGSLIPFYESQ